MFSKVCNLNKINQLVFKNKRFFDLHEYQSMGLMQKYKVNVPKFTVVQTSEDAKSEAGKLDNTHGLVVKAQVHAGGRGKGKLSSGLQGGVHVVKTPAEIADKASKILGYNLTTKQTTGDGLKVEAVMVAQGVKLKKEMYLAYILDRVSQKPAIVASQQGGMNIEEVAAKDPNAIVLQPIDPAKGIQASDLDHLINKLDIKEATNAREQITNMYNMFVAIDATQIEINPWGLDVENKCYTVDAKVNIDDNAEYRQGEILELKSKSLASESKDPAEEQASKAGLSYVALDGNIGCLVNGAGLAMATMDTIKLFGGWPANFLDVGGAASQKVVETAFNILMGHPNINTILINIFGGIVDCEMIAKGVLAAAKEVNLTIPLVIRLAGNNSDKGMKLIEEFMKANPSVAIDVAEDMAEASEKAAKKAARK